MARNRPLADRLALAGTSLALALAAAPGPASPAAAQAAQSDQSARPKVDADFSKYCREKVPNSALVRRGNDHYCNRGGSLQGIDYAEACRLTTGSRRYEVSGTRVLCLPGRTAGRTRMATRTDADISKYCRANYPNSTPARRGNRHYCNQGGTLQAVDLAEACRLTTGSPRYRVAGTRVLCRARVRVAPSRRTADSRRSADARRATPTPRTRPERNTGPDRRETARRETACRRAARRTSPERRSRARATPARGVYRWPHLPNSYYRGPLKNGKPHGIGRNFVDRPGWSGWSSIGRYADGKRVGPLLVRLNGRPSCMLPRKGAPTLRLPMSRCAHLRAAL